MHLLGFKAVPDLLRHGVIVRDANIGGLAPPIYILDSVIIYSGKSQVRGRLSVEVQWLSCGQCQSCEGEIFIDLQFSIVWEEVDVV